MKINTASTEDASCQRQFNSVCSALGVSTPIPALWSVNTAENVELRRHWTVFYFGLFSPRSGRVDCEWLCVAFLTRLIQGYPPSALLLSAHYHHSPPEDVVFATLMSDSEWIGKTSSLKVNSQERPFFTSQMIFFPHTRYVIPHRAVLCCARVHASLNCL